MKFTKIAKRIYIHDLKTYFCCQVPESKIIK